MPDTTQRTDSILIVEDDAHTRRLLVTLLSLSGYQAEPAASIAQGLERLDGHAFVLLDLNLPDGLGTIVLERIRSQRLPIRVAVISGTSDEELVNDAARLLPDLFLHKPIDVAVLLEWLGSADRSA